MGPWAARAQPLISQFLLPVPPPPKTWSCSFLPSLPTAWSSASYGGLSFPPPLSVSLPNSGDLPLYSTTCEFLPVYLQTSRTHRGLLCPVPCALWSPSLCTHSLKPCPPSVWLMPPGCPCPGQELHLRALTAPATLQSLCLCPCLVSSPDHESLKAGSSCSPWCPSPSPVPGAS